MSIDRYTKIVLTVIAVCLVWIAYAAGAPQAGPVEVNIVAVGGRRVPRSLGLPVDIQNVGLPVVIVADYTR